MAGGRAFSADPDEEVLRLALNGSAGSASPERLSVYPMGGGKSVGMGRRAGMKKMRSRSFRREIGIKVSILVAERSTKLFAQMERSSPLGCKETANYRYAAWRTAGAPTALSKVTATSCFYSVIFSNVLRYRALASAYKLGSFHGRAPLC